ncbi:MAG: response regulator [Myxococcales bacterium FL481]|nr:MAG: response regulator [Myxococcales bacterium FL481]
MTLHGASVLLVDDHDDLAASLEEILSDEGASVARATTVGEALELAQRRFEVALVDIGLPDATGLSLLPELKAAGDGDREVLVITGSAALDDAIAAVKAGAYDYVLKPFDPQLLLSSVARALEQVRLRGEALTLSAALRRSEANLRTMVDTVQALLLVLDSQGRVVRANRAAAALTGVDVGDLVGVSWGQTFVREQDRDQFAEVVAALVGGQHEHASHDHRIVVEGAAGLHERWISWACSALRQTDASVHVYASGLDVTETRELERRTRLSEKLAAVGTLAAGLAHEIRNPLNGAHLQLRVLERRVEGLDGGDRLGEPVRVVQSEITRLSRLVDDFLGFARPTEIHASRVDLCEVARLVVELERAAAKRADIEVVVDAPSEPVIIEGDREKLEQVLLNLVGNAVEAGRAGGRVEIGVHPGATAVRVVVSDDGDGISPDNLERIFEPFFSTKPNGTGLGMAICHSLVALHGGEMRVFSENGTQVEVELPRRVPSRAQITERAGSARPRS